MNRSRYTKVALCVGLGIGALLSVFALVFALEQKRTQAETGAILSAYLSDEVLHNVHDWSSAIGLEMIVQREAQSPGTWKWRWILLLDRLLPGNFSAL